MGADFYIFQYLKIEHNYGTAYIELSCKRGYFCDCLDPSYDSDTENPEFYNNVIAKIIDLYLTPSINPILLYANGNYINSRFEKKYDELVNYKIDDQQKYWKDNGILEDKEDIITIHKIEIRKKIE